MKMMDAFNAFDRMYRLFHLIDVRSRRHTVQRETDTVAQQSPGRNNDNDRNQQSDNRVDDIPSGMGNNNSGDNHADRYQCIGSHMQVSTFHIQVFILILHEKPCRKCIYNDSDTCHPSDRITLDRTRMQQFSYTFSNNNPDGHQEDDRIQEGYEYSAFLISIGIAASRVHLSQPESQHSQYQAGHISQVMPCIRQKS